MMSSGPKSLGVLSLILFSMSLLLLFLCSVDSFVLLRTNVTNLYFSSVVFFFLLASIQLSLPAHIVAILSHTFSRLCQIHLCFHLVRLSGSSSILFVCKLCHHLVLLHLWKCWEILYQLFITSPSHGTPHTFWIFSCRKGKPICIHIFLAMLHVPVLLSTHVSSSCLLKRNNRIIVLVSHSLIFSIVCVVHDQFSLPNVKTAQTWSTSLWHLIFHGTSLLLNIRIFQKTLFADSIRSSTASYAFPLTIHGTHQYLELVFKRKLIASRWGVQNHVTLLFWIIRTCLPQTCWLGFQVPSACHFNETS